MKDKGLKTEATIFAILSAVTNHTGATNMRKTISLLAAATLATGVFAAPAYTGPVKAQEVRARAGVGHFMEKVNDERLAQPHHGLAPRHLPAGEVQGDPRRHRRNRLEPRRVPRGARRAPAQPRPALRGVRHQRRRRAAPGHLALHGGHRAADVEEGPRHGHRVHLHDHPRHEAGLPRRQLQPPTPSRPARS